MSSDVNILTFTSLYPSAARPRHGIFVETRLRRLIARGGLRAQVVAPVPWFPFSSERWGEYGCMAATPRAEDRFGIAVHHPRYWMLPKVGMSMQPGAMARSALHDAEQIVRSGRVDLIDAHYLYPDGVAASG
jgi:teichuronic acid biosynthesis glycosyltransferase TuaC